jgi:DNA-directed RNA polymerase specialized sigma24 family protein
VDREPLPEEAAALHELVEQLYRPLVPCDRPILEKRLEGVEVRDIAEQTGRSERAVYRVLADVRSHLRELLEAARQEE